MGNDYFKFMENDYYESRSYTIENELNGFKNVGGLVTTSECDVKLNLLSALQNEQRLLLGKMKKSMEEDNIGTYKNLVMALKEITYLVQKEEEKIKNGDMYIDFGRDVSYIYFNGSSYAVKGNNIIEDVVNKVKWITDNDRETKIFIDFANSSSGVYDILKHREGFKNIKCLFVNN